MPVSPLAITELNSPNVPLVLQLRTYPKNLRQLLTTAHYNRAMNHSNWAAKKMDNVTANKNADAKRGFRDRRKEMLFISHTSAPALDQQTGIIDLWHN